jgi:hypothetical protein
VTAYIVHHAVRLWNQRQGASLPRLHQEVMSHVDAAELRRRSRGGTATVKLHGCRAEVRGQRPARVHDEYSGHSLVVVTVRLVERYV